MNTPNYGPANGKSYYSFTFGGVKYIVLEACFNNMKGEHYSEGNFKWTVNMIPDEELAWFKEELGKGTGHRHDPPESQLLGPGTDEQLVYQ